MRMTRVLWGTVLPLVLLSCWEGAARAGAVDSTILPAPSSVLRAGWAETRDGPLVEALGHSLTVIVLGWIIAVLLGVACGLLLGLSPWARLLTAASIDFSRSIPAVALVPVGILVFGFDLRAELAVVVFAAFWPILVNTVAGVEMVPSQLYDVASTLRLSSFDRTRKIVLPAAMPRIVVGMRLAMATAVVLTAVAEMTGNPSGIGAELVMAQTSVRPDTAMAYVLLIGTTGLLLNAALVTLDRQLRSGGTGRGVAS